jgi:tetratricopeptide (TPR) repeat protein
MNVANDPIQAREGFEENLKLFQEAEDRWGMAHTLFHIGSELRRSGNFTRSYQTHKQSLALFQECGDQIRVAEQNLALAGIAFEEGKYKEARTRFEEVLSFYRQAKFNLQIDIPLYMLGAIAVREGDYAHARAWYSECLLFDRQVGHYFQLAECLIGFASIAKAEKRFERAAQLMGAAQMQVKSRKLPLENLDRVEFERLAGTIREELDEAVFTAAWAAGHAMTREQAIAYALEDQDG